MPKNRSYNSVGAGAHPKLGMKSFEEGTARPGARSRIGGGGGPEAGMPARPGSAKGGRPAKPSKSGGTPPRVARPGGAQRATGRRGR
jgi:hypothetical protein